jgi:hypothetical protein
MMLQLFSAIYPGKFGHAFIPNALDSRQGSRLHVTVSVDFESPGFAHFKQHNNRVVTELLLLSVVQSQMHYGEMSKPAL